jgi:hypothetical protein
VPAAPALSEFTRHDHNPANHDSHWLFPGRQAGQPASYQAMSTQLRDLSLPMRTARISALRQLVLQVPAPVIADALGFHYTTTTRRHANAGGPWSRYAAGDCPQEQESDWRLHRESAASACLASGVGGVAGQGSR